MKTVIVTPQIPLASSGGMGTFTWHLTRLLRTHGDEVHIIVTHRPEVNRQIWQAPFEELGVPVTCIDEETMPLYIPMGYTRYQATAESVADQLPKETDVIYFADWEANGLHFVRNRRFVANKLPVCITVLHGGTKWKRQAVGTWPESYDDLSLDFQERYTIEHSDFIVARSQFILDWGERNGWMLPPQGHVKALGLPVLLESDLAPDESSAEAFDRIVYFGRIDTSKGIDLFIESLVTLNDRNCLTSIKEIVLLGAAGENIYGSTDEVVQRLQNEIPHAHVAAFTNLSSHQAQLYLAENAPSTLVVVPSRNDVLPYTAVEASLIPEVNLICSNAGGIPEIFSAQNNDQLFEPTVDSLVEKIDQWLGDGPRDSSRLCKYDWEAANQRWIAFHEEACRYARSIQTPTVPDQHRSEIVPPSAETRARLDVCIPYFNLGEYLPQLLISLDAQSTQDFNVFVINDGSADPQSIHTFEVMTQLYQHRGNWTFISTENKGSGKAKNLAASLGNADFICFMDADHVARPDMIERFLESISQSGDDCLTSNTYCFEGKGMDLMQTRFHGRPVLRTFHIVPVGNCATLGILNNPFGERSCILMRRSVFEAIGGFTADVPNYISYEDRELLTRLSLSGYKLDVVPDFLAHYRLRSDDRLRPTDDFSNDMRVVRHYDVKLRQVGLEDLAPTVVGQYYAATKRVEQVELATQTQTQNRESYIAEHQAQLEAMNARISELEQALRWHEKQSQNWEHVAAELERQIISTQAWTGELNEAVLWHQQQSRNWEQTATEREARIAELQIWSSELEEAVRWHEKQSQIWEQVATEREAPLGVFLARPKTRGGKLLYGVRRMLAALRKAATRSS